MDLKEKFDILFPLEKSIRYHQRRRAYYDSCHRLIMLMIIIAGSASVVDVLKFAQIWLGLLTAALGAIDLVFGLSDKARDHEFLMRRFSGLVARIRRSSSATPTDLLDWQAERIEIEADEPDVYWAVEAICYNEAARAWDRNPQEVVEVKLAFRLFQNIFRFDPSDFKSKAAI